MVRDRVCIASFCIGSDSCQFFISQFRGTNDQFIYGYGLFQDTWAPIATLGITILAALVGGYYWGLPGVLLGDVASSITVISIWKPYFYIATVLKCLLEFIGKCIAVFMYVCFSWALTDGILLSLALPKPEEGYLEWSLYALVSSLLFLSILTILFYNFSKVFGLCWGDLFIGNF